jgi:hypothetical protein
MILILSLFQNCADENTPKENPQTKTNEKNNNELAFPNSTGELITINSGSGKNITLEKKQNEFILSGDILLTPEQVSLWSKEPSKTGKTGLSELSKRWAFCTVYYTINPSLTNQQRVIDAIEHWKTRYPIDFVVRTTQTNYIEFIPADGCYSNLGMIGGRQVIGLGTGCSTGNTIHEIGHALGFFHEQQRTDRNNSININYANVTPGYEDQFRTYSELGLNGYQIGQLDFDSIMLYGSYAFSSNGFPTMTKLDGSTFIGQRTALSAGDLEMISSMYTCHLPPPPKITADGPNYLSSGVTMITWNYTGNLPNADLDSIIWWYRKVNTNGASYAIGWGATGYFTAVPDTVYSDPGFQTSDFKIYFTIKNTAGVTYTSDVYSIMKKGKFKLENSL